MRASSLFPILSTILLMLGGLCVGIGRIYRNKNNILLSAGILFVAAGRTRLTAPCTSTHKLAGQQIDSVQTPHTATEDRLPLMSALSCLALFSIFQHKIQCVCLFPCCFLCNTANEVLEVHLRHILKHHNHTAAIFLGQFALGGKPKYHNTVFLYLIKQ